MAFFFLTKNRGSSPIHVVLCEASRREGTPTNSRRYLGVVDPDTLAFVPNRHYYGLWAKGERKPLEAIAAFIQKNAGKIEVFRAEIAAEKIIREEKKTKKGGR
jgi:hypothetical protein